MSRAKEDALRPPVFLNTPAHYFPRGRRIEYLRYVGWMLPFYAVQTVTTNRLYFSPVVIPFPMTVDRLCVAMSAVSAGNKILGLYMDNGETPVGGALIVQTASAAKAVINSKDEEIIADLQLEAGLYWGAYLSDEGTSSLRSIAGSYGRGGTIRSGYINYGAYIPLPNPCPVLTSANANAVQVFLRVKSIP